MRGVPERAALEPGVLPTGPGPLIPLEHASQARTPLRHSARAARGRLRSGHRERRCLAALADLRRTRPVVPFDADEVRPSLPRRDARAVAEPHRRRAATRSAASSVRSPLTEPARHHALHGLLGWLDFEPIDKGSTTTSRSPATIEPQTGYPWRVVVETTFSLDADGLHPDGDGDQRESGCRALGHRTASVPGGRRGARRRLDPRPARSRGARGHARPAEPDRAAPGRRG